MGIDLLSAEAKRFGLDQKTGIEVPFETSRLVVPSKRGKRNKASAAGCRATPPTPQSAKAFSCKRRCKWPP